MAAYHTFADMTSFARRNDAHLPSSLRQHPGDMSSEQFVPLPDLHSGTAPEGQFTATQDSRPISSSCAIPISSLLDDANSQNKESLDSTAKPPSSQAPPDIKRESLAQSSPTEHPAVTPGVIAPPPEGSTNLPAATSEPLSQDHLTLPALHGPTLPLPDEFTPAPSSPLSSLGSLPDDPSSHWQQPPDQAPQSLGADADDSNGPHMQIAHDYDGPDGHQLLRLRPTAAQWADFSSILSFARRFGAENDGCFKVVLPDELLDALPERSSQKAPANAYRIHQIKRNGHWRVDTVPSEGTFIASEPTAEPLDTVDVAIQKLKKMFNKNKDKQLRSVRYRVDIPAWTEKQRVLAGVPKKSPIHPLKGDKLEQTKAIIPGIHTPYVYESASHFGATFQIHAEDFRLASLNHLYKGRKIWIVVPCTAVDAAEEALGRKKKCSQFMRHRAEFFFPDKLDKLGVPYRIVDQRPGETIVILPDAYHQGFSTGYTIAEAKNYAESDWSIDKYQACDHSCQLVTAIPAEYMRLLRDGEKQLDLCARYGDDETEHLLKRHHDGTPLEHEAKRIKV